MMGHLWNPTRLQPRTCCKERLFQLPVGVGLQALELVEPGGEERPDEQGVQVKPSVP